jgi:hypothetical protein
MSAFQTLNNASDRAYGTICLYNAMLYIRIRRIHKFLDLPDPDPSLFVRIWFLPPSSRKSNTNLDFYYFVTFYDFLSL